jgi:hypothetical protein
VKRLKRAAYAHAPKRRSIGAQATLAQCAEQRRMTEGLSLSTATMRTFRISETGKNITFIFTGCDNTMKRPS